MLNVKKALTKIFKQAEFKTLLWTNPNPTNQMSSQLIVNSGADAYDAIEVVYKAADSYNGYFTTRAPFIAGAHITLQAAGGVGGEFSGEVYVGLRTISMYSEGSLSVDTAVGTYSAGMEVNNHMCIPVNVFGVKLVGGVIRQLLSKFATLFNREGVAVC